MVCRHRPGDPDCGSSSAGQARLESERHRAEEERLRQRERDLIAMTPDSSNYRIEEAERIGSHLVVRVRYPSCSRCEFDGNKVMVFLNVTEMQVIRWRRIDPHFRPPEKSPLDTEAPSPAARFPATREGWADAVSYARGK